MIPVIEPFYNTKKDLDLCWEKGVKGDR